MKQLHFITKLLDIKDSNIQILDIITKDTHKEIIAKLDYEARYCPNHRNQMEKYDFQKTSKITYLELKLLSSRRITKFLVSSTKRLLKSWLKRLLWPILLISCPFQLQLSFENLMTLTVFLKLCPRTSTPLKWVLSYKALRISISSPFLKSEHSCHPKSLSSLRSNCSLSGKNHYYGYV